MGGFQLCNEASEALLAHQKTRASVLSMQKIEAVGAKRGDRGTVQKEPNALTFDVW